MTKEKTTWLPSIARAGPPGRGDAVRKPRPEHMPAPRPGRLAARLTAVVAGLRGLLPRRRTPGRPPAPAPGADAAGERVPGVEMTRLARARVLACRLEAMRWTSGDTGPQSMIAREIVQDFSHHAVQRLDELGLPAEATVEQMLARCRIPLQSRFGHAVREHLEALDMIATDPCLTPSQRRRLRAFARDRRLDPVQLREFQVLARQLKPLLARLAHDVECRGSGEALESLARMQDAFACVHARMAAHAEGLWVAYPFAQPAARAAVFRVCTELVIAEVYDDPILAHGMLVRLTGLEAAADEARCAAPGADAVAGNEAATRPSSIEPGLRYLDVVLAFAGSAGMALDDVARLRDAILRRCE